MVEQRRPDDRLRKHGGIRPHGGDEPTKMIQSVQRALRIMEFVGRHSDGVSAQRIAFECNLNRGTAYNLLRTLVYERYLRRDEFGRYSLGLEVSDRYSELTQAMAGPRTCGDFMRRMSSETGYSTFVAKFVEGRPAVTSVTEGNRSPHVEDLIVGFDDGAHATALGKALLATLKFTERAMFLKAAGMRRFTRRTLTEPEALEHDLMVYSESGVYAEMGQFQEGVGCAAVVVRDADDPADRVVLAAAMPLSDIGRFWPVLTRRMRRAAVELQPLL
jgi:DNA-binding IclR family transcriptional regulator